MDRLQKVLAQAGVASRRGAEELISQGKVKVNGKVVTELGTKVDPVKDKILLDGKPVKASEEKVYLLLNKPAGYVTTVKDPQGRRKVIDLLKGVKQRVYPVGRLDNETEGLLLLTNDGDLAYGLTHPKHGATKTYLAHVVGVPDPRKMRALREGIRLEDGMTAPAQARRLAIIEGNALIELKIHEGRNRQVRRMCESIGHPVMKLQRTELSGLTLEGVPLGSFRHLTAKEVANLQKKLPKVKPQAPEKSEKTPEPKERKPVPQGKTRPKQPTRPKIPKAK